MRWIVNEGYDVKKLLAILLALLSVLSLAACTSESLKNAENEEIYRENVVDFTLFVPEGWIVDTTTFVVSAHAGKDDDSTVTMTQAGLGGGYQEIPAIFENTKSELTKLYRFKTLKEAEKRKVAGVDAAVYHYSLTDKQSEVTLNYLQCLFIKDGTLYTFTYYAAPDRFDSHLDAVNQMLDAIAFGKKDAPKGMFTAVSAGVRDVDCSDFAISVPKDWMVDTSTGIFTAMGPSGDASCLSILRKTVEEGTTPAAYYDANKDALKDGLEKYELVNLKKDFIVKDTKGKSYNAVVIEYTATVSNQAYHFKQLFCRKDTTMFLVTFSAPEALYETHTEAIDNCLSSFTLNTK